MTAGQCGEHPHILGCVAPDDDNSIPTGRIRRTAQVGTAVGTEGVRYAGTRAANLARSREGASEALEQRHLEAAERMVQTLGRMKGAAARRSANWPPSSIPSSCRRITESSIRSSWPRFAPPRRRCRGRRCARSSKRERSGPSRRRSCSRTSSTRRPLRRSGRCTARCCPTAAPWPSRFSTPGGLRHRGGHAERGHDPADGQGLGTGPGRGRRGKPSSRSG